MKEVKPRMVTIYYMGKAYQVPEGITIIKALEYIGYRLVRGVGCRSGFCGACTTFYRKKNDYRLYSGLACQTPVEDGMYLTQLPFIPAERRRYRIEDAKADFHFVLSLYPEIARCVGCNSCTRVCPQEIQVMDAVQAILRGDLAKAAKIVFDCISCGACSMRCPAEIVHYNVFQLVRRLYGKYIAPKAKHLASRVEEIQNNYYEEQFKKLFSMSVNDWKVLAEKLQKKESITI
ncbi:MAG: 4Fe-4S dicluster domain-containing protein [Crenarchaeota archaeon]|nr:4Fe-4S dicluster domain-containing protein [Thermoproteota archaeon]